MGIIKVSNPVIIGEHYITSPFGLRTIGGKRAMHNGVDIVAWNGTSTTTADIIAFQSGKVIAEGFDNTKGNFIELRHTNCITVYYHMESRSDKSVGDTVQKGERLGYIGNTGNSTGAHLHFGLKETTWVDPVPYLEEEEMDYETFKTYMQKYEEEKKTEQCSDWASESVEWAEKNEILFGDGNGNLMPKAPCTREMMATFLARFYEMLTK